MKKPYSASDAKPSALFLAPEAPYPVIGGGPLRSASVLEYLARSYTVDVIVFREPGAPDPAAAFPAGIARRISVVPLRYHSRSQVSRALRNFRRFLRGAPPLNDRFSGYDRAVRSALGQNRYALGVVEHFWCACYADALREACSRIILDLHNIESALLKSSAISSSLPERLLFHRFAAAAERLERRWIPRFDQVLTASAEDADRVRALAPKTPPIVYPNAIPLLERPVVPQERSIVFSGNLAYHPNVEGVRYFYEQIWPVIRRECPDLRWRLIGKNPEGVRGMLRKDPRIDVVGPVAEALPELGRSLVAVVPLRSGSGTRVKILEAWAAGVPVVSTPIGAEGLEARDGTHLYLASKPDAFARSVIELVRSEALRTKLLEAGRALYEARYNWPAAWQGLREAGL